MWEFKSKPYNLTQGKFLSEFNLKLSFSQIGGLTKLKETTALIFRFLMSLRPVFVVCSYIPFFFSPLDPSENYKPDNITCTLWFF